jgi:predicted ester cyclase
VLTDVVGRGCDNNEAVKNHQKEFQFMTAEQNKEIVRRFYAAFEVNDESALQALLAPDLEAYVHNSPRPQSREEMLGGIKIWHASFSDVRFDIQEQIAEGDKVATRMAFRSTHSGDSFMGQPPSHKPIDIHAVSIEQVKDGRIVWRRVLSDWYGLMQQLGALPQ